MEKRRRVYYIYGSKSEAFSPDTQPSEGYKGDILGEDRYKRYLLYTRRLYAHEINAYKLAYVRTVDRDEVEKVRR